MDEVESSVNLFHNGCACSQAILAPYCKRYGLELRNAMKIAAGFAGGMRMGETCGAVTGSFMVLGMHSCEDDCDKGQGRAKVYSLIREFTSRFEKENNSTKCKELLGCDISTTEGMEYAQNNNLFNTTCTDIVRKAAIILQQMIKEN